MGQHHLNITKNSALRSGAAPFALALALIAAPAFAPVPAASALAAARAEADAARRTAEAAAAQAREAGAEVTDAFGAPLAYNKHDPRDFGVLVCSPAIHAAAVERLAERAKALR
jgi:hypothetical protein